MVLLLKNIVLRCGPGCFCGALARAFVKIPYVPAPHFSWRASYSICQNPICPCTTLVAWVGTPRSIQRGVLDSGHGRSIQRGVLDRWMHSRTVSARKKWEKKFNSIAQLFSMHKISKLKFLKALIFQCIRPLMSKPLIRSQAEGLFIKDRNTLKSQGFQAFQFHFQKPGIDKKCIRWGLLVCLCSCLVYKYSEASTWKNPADTCCKVQRGQHLEESSGHLL